MDKLGIEPNDVQLGEVTLEKELTDTRKKKNLVKRWCH